MEEKDDNFFNWYRGINMNNHVRRANYNVEYTLLLELISKFMKRVVRTDKCKANHEMPEDETPSLQDIMCHFSYIFSPKPGQYEEKRALTLPNRRIGGHSEFGRIFSSTVSG